MGLFKKIKDIFYDEEIVEEPIRKEESKKEVSRPAMESIISNKEETIRVEKIEDKNPDNISERELFKPEKTFDFPVFEDEEPVKARSKTNVLELQRELERRSIDRNEDKSSSFVKSEKAERTFTPSPVISPVYGILDKNYQKEQVVEKKEKTPKYSGEKNYDYVRRKAYGTLEDELEDTLTRVNNDIVESVNELEKEIDEIPKPSQNIEQLLNEIEKNASVSIGELEERAKNKLLEEENDTENDKEEDKEIKKTEPKIEEKEEVSDNTLEHDLFDLIDSMYEDKEE